MEQLGFFQEQETERVCVFTGHRELEKDFSKKVLQKAVDGLIEKGVTEFYCGMALGFDLCAAEAVLKRKKKNKELRLISCIPCRNQERYYPEKEKTRYAKIIYAADEKIFLSEEYYKGCMLARDRYMADRADVMIAYCKKETGGTAYTVRYFQKKKPQCRILFI